MLIDALWMPLCPVVWESRMFDCLDLTIISTHRRYSQSLSEDTDSLMMYGVDPGLRSEYISQKWLIRNTSSIYKIISPIALIVFQATRDILDETATMGNIEELHPLADTEDRLLSGLDDGVHSR